MLKARLLTALVLIPLFVWGTIAMPTAQFGMLLSAIIALGAWEWAGLAASAAPFPRWSYVFVITVLGWLLYYAGDDAWCTALLVAVVWWLTVTIWLLSYHRHSGAHVAPVFRSAAVRAAGLVAGGLTLVPPWLALVILHGQRANGPYYVLFVFVLIWAADIGAYFVGRTWGQRRLAPTISPGKTWEGVAGGLALATVVAWGGGVWFGFADKALLGFLALCLLTVVFSVVGDLTESVLKRRAQVKDSGHLLPGHGGILDRVDSLTAAAPVFVAGLWLQGVFGT